MDRALELLVLWVTRKRLIDRAVLTAGVCAVGPWTCAIGSASVHCVLRLVVAVLLVRIRSAAIVVAAVVHSAIGDDSIAAVARSRRSILGRIGPLAIAVVSSACLRVSP